MKLPSVRWPVRAGRIAYVQHLGYTSKHSNWSGPPTSMVFASGGSSILWATGPLFNKSIATSMILKQWKIATITPVPKIARPWEHADFRPISVTSVLSRALERIIVREFIYPALLEPPAQLSYTDQYVFRPTESTTATIINHHYSPIRHRTTFMQSICGSHCS